MVYGQTKKSMKIGQYFSKLKTKSDQTLIIEWSQMWSGTNSLHHGLAWWISGCLKIWLHVSIAATIATNPCLCWPTIITAVFIIFDVDCNISCYTRYNIALFICTYLLPMAGLLLSYAGGEGSNQSVMIIKMNDDNIKPLDSQ